MRILLSQKKLFQIRPLTSNNPNGGNDQSHVIVVMVGLIRLHGSTPFFVIVVVNVLVLHMLVTLPMNDDSASVVPLIRQIRLQVLILLKWNKIERIWK